MEEFSKDVFTYDDKEYPINIDVKKRLLFNVS